MNNKDKEHLYIAYTFCWSALDVIIEGHLEDISKYSKRMFTLSSRPHNDKPMSQKDIFNCKVWLNLEKKLTSSQEALSIALEVRRKS